MGFMDDLRGAGAQMQPGFDYASSSLASLAPPPSSAVPPGLDPRYMLASSPPSLAAPPPPVPNLEPLPPPDAPPPPVDPFPRPPLTAPGTPPPMLMRPPEMDAGPGAANTSSKGGMPAAPGPVDPNSPAGLRAAQRTAQVQEDDALKALEDKESARQVKQQQLAQEAHDTHRAMLAADAAHNAEIQAHEVEAQKATGDELKAIRAESDRVASMKVDPRRLVQEKGAMGAIMGGIGAALGALGASLTGGRNQFLDQVDKAIDQDIQAQVANIGNAQQALATKRSLYGDMLAKFGNDRAALVATKDATLGSLQRYLEDVKAQSESVQTQANADHMIADIQQRRAQNAQQFAGQRLAEHRAAMAAAAAAQHQARAEQRADRELDIKATEAEAKMAEASGKNRDKVAGRTFPNLGGVAHKITDGEIKDVRDQSAALDELESIAKQMQDLRKNRDLYDPKASAQLEDLGRQWETAYGVAKKMGAMSKTEEARAGLSGEAASSRSITGAFDKVLQQRINGIGEARARYRKTYDIRPAEDEAPSKPTTPARTAPRYRSVGGG